MDLDAPIISGLRPGHRRGTASPVVVPAGHHSTHQRSPSVTPDIQLPSEQPSTRTGRTDTVKQQGKGKHFWAISNDCYLFRHWKNSWNQFVMSRVVHRPLPPHAVIGPGRDLSPVEITHLLQQIQVLLHLVSNFVLDSLNHLILHSKQVLLMMLLCLNQQPSRHKWRLSVNLQLQHPLWPSALIVVLLTSSSIIRRVMCFFFFFFCWLSKSFYYSLLVCIYPSTRIRHQLERLTLREDIVHSTIHLVGHWLSHVCCEKFIVLSLSQF